MRRWSSDARPAPSWWRTGAREPQRRPPMQIADLVRRHLGGEPLLKEFLEEGMVSVPEVLMVQRGDEQLGSLEPIHAGLCIPGRVGLAQDRLAQRGAEPIQDGGPQQEGVHRRELVAEHLVHEEARDVGVLAG